MAALGRACQLCLVLAAASAFPVYDVTAGPELATNAGRGTSFTALGRFDSNRAIQCYADYGNNNGAGTCKVLRVDGTQVEVLSTHVFNDNETQEITVAAFDDAAAVVCYSDKGNTKLTTCNLLRLEVSDSSLSSSEPVVVNTDAEEVPFLSLASLSDTVGVLCWTYVKYSEKGDGPDGAGACNKLTLVSGNVVAGSEYMFDDEYAVSDISVKAFSGTSAVVCYSAQGEGTCVVLSLSDAGSADDFTQGSWVVFHAKTTEFFESLETIRFTAAQGAVCYADGKNQNQLECKVLQVSGTTLTVGTDIEVVNEYPTSWMTATAITDSAALVCYATKEGGNVNGQELDVFKGLGTCNVLGLSADNTTVNAGPPNEVNSNPTQQLALASLDAASSAVLCYSDFGAGSGYCMALSMAPTTTTTTVTTSTSTTSTITVTSVTETSTTSPHTTTETSTSTETSTTSFHTTTATETTVTTMAPAFVDSGSLPPAFLSAGAALAAALVAAANLAA